MTKAKNNCPTSLTQLLTGLALVLGILGVLACIAASAAVWFLGSRLGRANEMAFEIVDTSLVTIEDRVIRLQRRAEESRITADEIRQGVEKWSKNKTGEYLAERLKVAEKAGTMSAGLQQADLLLEMSLESLRRAGRTVELGNTIGARLNPEAINQSLDMLASLQEKVQASKTLVDQIREYAEKLSGDDTQKVGRERILGFVPKESNEPVGQVLSDEGEFQHSAEVFGCLLET